MYRLNWSTKVTKINEKVLINIGLRVECITKLKNIFSLKTHEDYSVPFMFIKILCVHFHDLCCTLEFPLSFEAACKKQAEFCVQ